MPSLDPIPEDDSISCIFEWPDRPSRPGFLNPIMWWKMEESGSGDRTDSLAGFVLHKTFGAGSKSQNISGKILNCLEYTGIVVDDLTVATPLLNFSNPLALTLCGWFEQITTAPPNPALIISLLQKPVGGFAEIVFNCFGTGDVVFSWNDTAGNVGSQTFTGVLPLLQWNFFVFILNAGILSFSINDGPITPFSATPLAFPSHPNGSIEIQNGAGSTSILLDEFGAFQGAMIQQQVDSLWNGGNGVTFP